MKGGEVVRLTWFRLVIGAMVVVLLGWGIWTIPLVHEATAQQPSLAELQKDTSRSWPTVLGNYAGWRYSPLNQINTGNVRQLRPVFEFSTGVLRGHEGSPLYVGGTLYINTPFPNIVYALDLTKPGWPIKWRFVPPNDEGAIGVACCDTINRGLVYDRGKLYFATLDAHAIALDARTGKMLWRTKIGEIKRGETITMQPLVVGDTVFVGISGGEFGIQGRLTALNANTGEILWRAYSVGTDNMVRLGPDFKPFYSWMQGKDLGIKTWPGEQWKLGGGAVWGWLTYDPELKLLYYATSNPGTWNPSLRRRPGTSPDAIENSNLWATTVFARDPRTGNAKWAYQYTPHDEWDYDGVNEHILVDMEIGGRMRKVLVHFDRNGFAYTIDRQTGEVLVAKPYVHVNVFKGIDMRTGRPIRVPEKSTRQGAITRNICPSLLGGKDFNPAAYSPRTRLFYTITNNLCMDFGGIEVSYTAGTPYVGAKSLIYPGPGGHRSEFIAWDAKRGRKVWGIRSHVGLWSGTLVTGGDLAFYGDMAGYFYAVNARTGEVLWKFKTGSGIIGDPMTFRGPDGKQYVAVYSGVGGAAGLTVSGDLDLTDPWGTFGLVNAWRHLVNYTAKGGMLYVFGLP